MTGPGKDAKSDPVWISLKAVLYKVLDNRNLTNKNIRRRICRLIFVIADESDLEQLSKMKQEAQLTAAAAPKPLPKTVKAPPTRSESLRVASPPAVALLPSTKSSASSTAVEVAEPSIPLVVKSFDCCLEELRAARTPAEVDAAISAVSASSTGAAATRVHVKEQLQQMLGVASSEESLVSNTKIKRKALRLIRTIEDMSSSSSSGSGGGGGAVEVDVALEPKANSNNGKVSTVTNKGTPAATAASVTAPVSSGSSSSSTSVVSIPNVVERLKAVRTAEELDSVLVQVDMRQVVVAAAADSNSSGSGAGDATAIALPPPLATAVQRRQLKRAIEEVLGQEEVSQSMNSKVRRRVARITSILAEACNGNDGDSANAIASVADMDVVENAHASGAMAGKKLVIPSVGGVIVGEQPQKKVPYVAFVGNLSYETTAADIEAHLRAKGAVEGPVQVRLRSNAQTGQSLGIAFVEVQSVKELHQCVALHHSTLRGRVINVEKSCGGRNKEQRGQKISSKRSEQQRRVEEGVNRVLVQFEQQGVLQGVHKWGETLKDKVYSYSPAHVAEVRGLRLLRHTIQIQASIFAFVLKKIILLFSYHTLCRRSRSTVSCPRRSSASSPCCSSWRTGNNRDRDRRSSSSKRRRMQRLQVR